MGCLLMTRTSIDAFCRKQESDFEMALYQNEAKTTEAIREAKAHCGTAIREAEACYTTANREEKARCADHACSIQQLHSDSMQCLKREALKEEGKDCQSFLATCGAALQACPPEDHGVLMYPLQLLTGNMSLATLLAIYPQASTTNPL